MAALTTIAFVLTALAYLGLALAYGRHFFREAEGGFAWVRMERPATLGIHALFLALLSAHYRQFALINPFNLLTFLALALAIVHTALELRFKTRETGVFFFAICFALHVASFPGLRVDATAAAQRQAASSFWQSPLFGPHIGAALLGYVAFLVSALYGALYLAMYHDLKARRFGLFYRKMPPLDLLANVTLHAALIGFVCLTLAIVIGASMAASLGLPFLSDIKFIQTIAAWTIYALLLGARYAFGWRGRPQVAWLVAGFCLMALSSVVARFFTSFHLFS